MVAVDVAASALLHVAGRRGCRRTAPCPMVVDSTSRSGADGDGAYEGLQVPGDLVAEDSLAVPVWCRWAPAGA